MGFQRVINQQPAIAVEGDLASNNPMASVLPPVDSGFVVAPAQSVRVGYFAWGGADGRVYSSAAAAGPGAKLGFVARQANIPSVVITQFLGESRMTLEQGMPCTLQSAGDYFASLPGADPGDAVFAVNTTGQPSLVDDATTDPTGFVASSQAKVNAVTDAATTIALNTGVMTVAAVASGVIEAGQRVTGVGVPDETYIVRQLTGPAGGVGTYQTNSYLRAAVPAFTATMVQGSLAIISKPAA